MKKSTSRKNRYTILKLSGFRIRMMTPEGRQIIKNRRKKGRYNLVIKY